MEKIFITTQTGQKIEVGVVRLFRYNDSVFFIYTLSEKDANNYVKLYVTKVNLSNMQSVVISEASEWETFKDVMKTIIKNNRNNAPLEVTDLDAKTIENITVYDPKVFKLSEEMANFLQMNIKLSNTISEVAPAEPLSTVPDVFASPTTEATTNSEGSVGDVNANVQPQVTETQEKPVIDVSALSGDISANPEPVITNTEPQVAEIPESNNNENDNAPLEVNANNEVTVNSEEPVVSPDADSNNQEIDYKVAYLEEQLKVETLNTKVATLEAQIKLLEQKLQQIKNIAE